MSLPDASASTRVVVTGASSGIGTLIARGLAARGHDVAIVARRADRLEELAAELRDEYGVEVAVHPADLGDRAARKAVIAALLADERAVVGLCNCAGFGSAGPFQELNVDREIEQVEVNATALLELTHAFLGPMIDHGAGAILNVASIAAFQPLPGMATYSGTKAFVQTFSEAIHADLSGTGVSCTALCPGPVETEWAERAGAQAVMIGPAKVSPDQVAREAVEGMVAGKRSVVPGLVPKAMALSGHYVPRTILLPALRLGSRLRSKR